MSTILANFFGTPNLQFSVDSLVTHTTHTFGSTHDLLREVERARIYAGFHYHHSVIHGTVLGTKVARQIFQRFFAPAIDPRDYAERACPARLLGAASRA